MRVLLANPPWLLDSLPGLAGVRAGSRWPHFTKLKNDGKSPSYAPFPFFLSIAAGELLAAGHEVLLIDGVAEGSSLRDFYSRAAGFAPSLVFLETSTPSFNYDMGVFRELRRLLPGAALVSGGAHSPVFAAGHMRNGDVPDFWLAGEYERPLAALAAVLEAGGAPDSVPGLIKRGGEFKAFSKCDQLDSLATPPYDQLPVGNYSDPVCGLPSPQAQTWLSRGCPFNCSFCVWPQIVYGDRTYRTRSVEKALAEVRLLIDSHGCESFYFDDDTTNIGEDRMRQLAEGISSSGLDSYPWAMMARADCMTRPMLRDLASAGIYAIKYGVESVSRKLVDACDKGTNLERLSDALEATRELGIKTHLTFTFGLPGETPETIMETVDFAIRTAPESAQFSVCAPFPGTKFYQECVDNGWLLSLDFDSFLGSGEEVVLSTPSLSAETLSRCYDEALSKWRAFLDKRLAARKAALVEKLVSETSAGARWRFLGDREFADFIFEGAACRDSLGRLVSDDSFDLTVIVSCHDEEKIFRRLLRDKSRPQKKVLRLYN